MKLASMLSKVRILDLVLSFIKNLLNLSSTFLLDNPSWTIEHILASESRHDLFAVCEVVPKRFLADLADFNEDLLAKKRDKKLDICEDDAQDNLIPQECEYEHPCCRRLLLELAEVNAKLSSSEKEIASLRGELAEFRDRITSQLVKFNKPETTPMQTGDLFLPGGWILRGVDVAACAADPSKFDLATLLDKVFGPGYLTQFESFQRLKSPVKEACKTILGKISQIATRSYIFSLYILDEYAKAKQAHGVGTFDACRSLGQTKLRRKISNAKYQEDKKKKKHLTSEDGSSVRSEVEKR